ncbi:MAG: cupin domain-containing protein [Rhizobiaceae bacterium]
MENFFSINDTGKGIARKLSDGITTNIFPGDQAMISIVRLAPEAKGNVHHHPEEQWGYLIEGSAIRIQDDQEIPVKTGDFWRTPANVPHTIIAGPEGAVVFDVFAPPREVYLKPGEGFGTD